MQAEYGYTAAMRAAGYGQTACLAALIDHKADLKIRRGPDGIYVENLTEWDVPLAGLWVRGGQVTQRVVKAHPEVAAFYGAGRR